MHRRHRKVEQRACRWRFFGSVAGRRANWPRDFDQDMRGIMRDYIGVDRQPPAYVEETFERRFRVPRCLFMGVYETIRDGPFVRQSINATGRPPAHVLQKLVAAFCMVAVAQQNVDQVIGGREAFRTCPLRACTAIGPSDPGSQAARGDDTRHGLLAGDDGASHRRRPSS